MKALTIKDLTPSERKAYGFAKKRGQDLEKSLEGIAKNRAREEKTRSKEEHDFYYNGYCI